MKFTNETAVQQIWPVGIISFSIKLKDLRCQHDRHSVSLMWCTSTRLVTATQALAHRPAFYLSAPDTQRADGLLTWGGRLLVFSCSLLSELQIRPQRNLIRWVSKCRQPDGFYGDGTCRPVDHFPLKKMHQQHSFMTETKMTAVPRLQ